MAQKWDFQIGGDTLGWQSLGGLGFRVEGLGFRVRVVEGNL